MMTTSGVGGNEWWFIQIIISKLCLIVTRDPTAIFCHFDFHFPIVLVFMDHEQRKTNHYWGISRKFFWVIKQPFSLCELLQSHTSLVPWNWIRWTWAMDKETSLCNSGCLIQNSTLYITVLCKGSPNLQVAWERVFGNVSFCLTGEVLFDPIPGSLTHLVYHGTYKEVIFHNMWQHKCFYALKGRYR